MQLRDTLQLIKSSIKFSLVVPLLGLLAPSAAQAQSTTVGWNFTDLNAVYDTGTPVNFTVGSIAIANSYGTVTAPISSTSASSGYTGATGGGNIGNAVNNAAFSTATSPNTTVTFTPAAGYSLQITKFDFGARSTSTGATAYALYSSVDNYTTPIFTGSLLANSTWTLKSNPSFTLNGAPNTPVTLRLYTYNGASNAGSGTINTRLDDIAITVAAVAAPIASQVRVETAADGSGSVVSAQNLIVGQPLTSYSVSRDASSVFVTNAQASWSLVSKTGGVVDADLVPAADGKSATFTPHAAGSAIIHASVTGLTSVDSGTITAVLTPTNPTAAGSASSLSVIRGQNVVLSVAVTPGANPTSSGLAVTADLSSIGGSSSQTFYDDGTHGDATAGNNTFTFQATVPASTTRGSKTLPVVVTDSQGRTANTTITFNVVSTLTVLHMNDTHARVTPHKWIIPQHDTNLNPTFENVGGAAYLAGEILSLTTSNPNALVLDAGDISEGNPIGDMGGNGSMTQFYALLSSKLKAQRGRGLDAVVVGNHDVRDANYIANLANLAATGVPVLSVNVCNKGTQTPYFAASTTVTIDGVKIGILGYTTQASEVGASLANTLDIVNCDWTSTDTTKIHLADKVKDLRTNQGCDLVILLAHIGHSALVDPTAPLLVDDGSTKLPEVAVTGHWHTWTDTVWQPEMLNYKTIFTESCSYMKYLGELTIDSTGKYVGSVQHVIRNSAITPDADVQALVDNLKATYNASHTLKVDDVVGYSANALLLDNKMKWWSADEYPWSGNNTAGQWICDAMQWKAAQLWGACDLSIEAGGGVRSDIPAGPVTFMQVYETFPWNDDTFCLIRMTGQEIINFLKATNCDAGFSGALDVTAYDGVPTTVKFNGSPINLTQSYSVCINNYMYAHPPTNWTWSDTNPQYRNDVLCRDGIVEFMQTQHGTPDAPYSSGGPRYHINTDFAGGFRAVVTMMNDNDTKTTFDDAFIRLISATPETLGHRDTSQLPADLVNTDGSVIAGNRLAEIELYRSYLGFKPGALKPGDIIETWGKGSFYGGDPEFVDQEGIYGDGVEFKVVGHDDSLAKPANMSSIAAFWDDAHKNHYVKFLGKKTGASTVADQFGQTLSVMDVTAYASKTLPGNIGDLLILTGTPTMESYALRFRCDSAVLASTQGITQFPPVSNLSSQIGAVPPSTTSGPLTLTATATVSSSYTFMLAPTADAQVASGAPTTNYGSSNNLYIQSSNTSSYGNERSWLKFDLSPIPAGSTITSATLQMYCWKAAGAALATEVDSGNDDSWTEAGLTWNNQPGYGSALDTQTLAAGSTVVWYNWNVASFVQSKWTGTKLVSLLAKAVTENSADATAPSYGFDAKEYGSNAPVLKVTTSAPAVTIKQIQFFYRFSSDNASWGSWTAAGTSTTAPYAATFNFPQGYGYYEFYSQATDSSNNVEPAPIAAQTATHYAAVPPYPTTAIVSLGNLAQTYDGNPHAASATTLPPGLTIVTTYNGSTTAPTNGGTYTVVATVNQPGYSGSTTGSLYIARIPQTITFGSLASKKMGDAPFNLSATASSGLAVSFTSSDPKVATISGSTVTIVGPGTVTITADQAGNSNYSGAPSVTQTLVVTGTAGDGGDVPAMPAWALVLVGAGLLFFARRLLQVRSA